MSAILEIPEVRQRVSHLSVQEYHQLGEFNEDGRRTELIRGIIIEKISKSPAHRTIGSLLYDLLARLLPKGYSIWKEEPLTFADSEPEPDISVTRGEKADYAVQHPTTAELVVEVAVSSAALDRENSLYMPRPASRNTGSYLHRNSWSRSIANPRADDIWKSAYLVPRTHSSARVSRL